GPVDLALARGGDEPKLLEFYHCLVDLGQKRTGCHRNDDVIWRFPTQLLHCFIEERLRAFGVIRTDVDVDEGPTVFRGHFAAEAVVLVVWAPDSLSGCSVDQGG